ncbi:molybdenum cofactor guanylyltransferase [Paenibacillus mesophilus]|uniref:molybdenum cofactor guanylyltransferase n=1 Tax=Paenibacillus mesophilus TaxID=2582849 RepID=UPI00110ED6B0|nr:molybdenum cofactor guanylyltransferase [Paenibacillus mesophilus]TMV48373.1 molybdenum cofactor guanylyltransferase [Paenibacillus mesophilus]
MLSGVILAGGENRRMGGRHKALLPIGGEKLVQRQIRLMAPVCPEIIVVTNDPELFAPHVGRSVKIVADHFPGKGPLAGMHAALSDAGNEHAWVVGCDMPFLSSDAARHMLDKLQRMELDAVIPRLDGRLHPLHGVYRSACVKQIAELLADDTYRVMELFGKIRWEPLHDGEITGIDLRFAVNANTPEEWAEVLRMEGG